MPSVGRYKSMLKQKRKESKITNQLLNLLFKPLTTVAKTSSKVVKKTTRRSSRDLFSTPKNNIDSCPICGTIVNNNYNGLKFNNEKICSSCQNIIEHHFKDKKNRDNIYLDDLKKIVSNYYNK